MHTTSSAGGPFDGRGNLLLSSESAHLLFQKKMLAKIQKAEPTSFRSKQMVLCNCSLSVPRRVGTVFAQPRGARQNLARD